MSVFVGIVNRRLIAVLVALGVMAVVAANVHLVLVAASSDSGCVATTSVIEDGVVVRQLAPAKRGC